jgi:hypothetical protein
MKQVSTIPVSDPKAAFLNFQEGLSRALRVSKDELAKLVAQDNAERTGDRVQRGYAKRGPKSKVS